MVDVRNTCNSGFCPFLILSQTIAFTLIDTVQSRATDIQSSADSLSMTVTSAIDSYEGVQASKRSIEAGPISRVMRAVVPE